MPSFWKPLKGPVVDWPLALCDAATVEPADFHPHDFVFSPIKARENMMVYYNKNHKWYYLSNQNPHEVFIFRQADSEQRPRKSSYTTFSQSLLNDMIAKANSLSCPPRILPQSSYTQGR